MPSAHRLAGHEREALRLESFRQPLISDARSTARLLELAGIGDGGIGAEEVGVSRSTLSRRFVSATGEAPGTYLTRWRIDLAARRLRDTDDSPEVIAHSIGYTSVYAFSRAFSRLRSVPPGQYRTRARS